MQCPNCGRTVSTWAAVDLKKVMDGTAGDATWRQCPCGESVPFPKTPDRECEG